MNPGVITGVSLILIGVLGGGAAVLRSRLRDSETERDGWDTVVDLGDADEDEPPVPSPAVSQACRYCGGDLEWHDGMGVWKSPVLGIGPLGPELGSTDQCPSSPDRYHEPKDVEPLGSGDIPTAIGDTCFRCHKVKVIPPAVWCDQCRPIVWAAGSEPIERQAGE